MDAGTWAVQEFATVDLGDRRRTRRLIGLADSLSQRPDASIPEALGRWADTKGAYRFLSSEATDPDEILAGHQDALRNRAADEPVLLAIQDTTELNFTSHEGLAGRGCLSRPGQQGVLLHTTLAATDAGVPLGVLDQQVWTRDPAGVRTKAKRRSRPTADKESQRWLDAELRSTAIPARPGATVITIADREGDIFDWFAQERPEGCHLLVRTTHDRRLADWATRLRATLEAAPVLGRHTVAVGRRSDRPPRDAILSLRAVPVRLAPPHGRCGVPVPVIAILATEETVPDEGTPIRWMLTTTLTDATLAGAMTAVRRYACRWLVERYHYVLKQGCQIERLQLETVDRLKRALAIYAVVSWRLLWLTYQARRNPDQPCTTILTPLAWTALWAAVQPHLPPPEHPPTLKDAVRLIARLGGFLNRTGDGDPGIVTIWRGWARLTDICTGIAIAHNLNPSLVVGNE